MDHLGSTRLVTDESGAVVSWHDYLPFGEEIPAGFGGRGTEYGATDNVRQRFTGKERDVESDLDYFEARYMSSAQGRFTSPDPLGGQLEDPQTLNKYTYARNNPLAFTDPTGLYICRQIRDGDLKSRFLASNVALAPPMVQCPE